MQKIKLGMVGGGKDAFIGSVHRMAARLDDRYDLVAGALSSSPIKASESAAEIGIDKKRSYTSNQEMAKEEEIGSVAEQHYTFMGAADPRDMEKAALEVASKMKQEAVDTVFLVPV